MDQDTFAKRDTYPDAYWRFVTLPPTEELWRRIQEEIPHAQLAETLLIRLELVRGLLWLFPTIVLILEDITHQVFEGEYPDTWTYCLIKVLIDDEEVRELAVQQWVWKRFRPAMLRSEFLGR